MVTELTALDASATATLVSEDDRFYEIVNGERRELEPMSAYAVLLGSRLCRVLDAFAEEHRLGAAVSEMLFVLFSEPRLERRPDVAFVSYARWTEPPPARRNAWAVIPNLAVEVISPTNRAEEIDAKLSDYFEAGVELVWVIYPDSRRIYVYRSPTNVAGLRETDELDGGDVLPGFRVRIRDLFESLNKPA